MDEEDRAAAGTEHPYLSGERLQCAVKIGCPYSLLMSRDFDYRAEAEEAMREAAAATTAVERIMEWRGGSPGEMTADHRAALT